ncbi:MAG: type II secretion system protein [Candidatus Komeilibacteria bacterium]|nr:type II secretion system protein [Candidatus Komeilibacteria bacterium]
MNKKYQQGFTLIELLVVISIIGILSTLAVVSLNDARTKARDAKRISDVKQVQTALELFLTDRNGYPAGNDLTLGNGAGATLSRDAGFAEAISGTTFMGTVPANPTPNGIAYKYTAYTTSAKTSVCAATPCSWYEIVFELEGQTGGISAGVRRADPNGLK